MGFFGPPIVDEPWVRPSPSAGTVPAYARSPKEPLVAPGAQFGDERGSWRVVRMIGQGGYGDVFAVTRVGSLSGELFAAKIEREAVEGVRLSSEICLLAMLQDTPLVPRIFGRGALGERPYFVMELLGPTLSNLRRCLPQRRYGVSSTIRLGYYMLRAIEAVHQHGVLHLDVKPGNFMTVLREGSDSPVALVDFGLSRQFRIPQDGRCPRRSGGFRGTAKYASLWVHSGEDQAPRDDLTSWLYSVSELLNGRLPWSEEVDFVRIERLKREARPARLFAGLPGEFSSAWTYVAGLRFDSRVDYGFLVSLVLQAASSIGVLWSSPFDWEGLAAEDYAQYAVVTGLPRACVCNQPLIPVVEDEEPLGRCRCKFG